jgi:agmatinase
MVKSTTSFFKPATLPFMGTVRGLAPAKGTATIFGAPHGTPYRGIDNRVHQKAPQAFRAALKADALWVEHWDFDFDGPLLPDKTLTGIDLGDIKTLPRQGAANRKLIESATRACVDAGSVPLMFGGDDSTPIPFLAGFAGGNPVTVLQLDAHIDWRDERQGEGKGFSSTMRRASEMGHVWRIVQVGARGLGSARAAEVEAAQKWGAHIHTARSVHAQGIAQVLSHIEQGSDCVICLDLDVLDSAVMPAVAAPSPGGFSYNQVVDVIAGVAAKARIAGFSMVEFVPTKDSHGVFAYTAARIALHVLAHVVRQKQ